MRAALAALLLAPGLAAALEIQPVAEGVWALVGETTQRSAENLANNATFGVVETADGVVLVDPGGSWKGAEAIHAAIRTLTDKPVVWVVNTGGQDHRWLGNGYWKAQGAQVIASEAAVADQMARADMQMAGLAACMLKGAERVAPMLGFAFRGIEVSLHGVRQDSPPKMVRIDYELIVDTDESDQRLDLLHRNIRKYGTISNTLAETVELVGAIRRKV